MRIRLHIGVAAAFTLLTVIMIGATVAYLYFNHRNLALETAREDMVAARSGAIADLMSIIVPTGETVATTAKLVATFPEGVRTLDGMGILYSEIRNIEHFYGLHIGFEENGAFYQVVKLPPEAKTFGPDDFPIPEGSRIVLRRIDGPAGEMVENYIFQSEWGRITGTVQGKAAYDPRTRPWYKAAQKRDGIHATNFYLFESTGRPGVTFAHRILGKDGRLIGVVGADLTLNGLVRILNDMRIGEEGQVFLLDRDDRLIAHTGTRREGEGLKFAGIETRQEIAVEDPLVAEAISDWLENRREFFDFSHGEDGRVFIGSAGPIPKVFGVYPTLGLVVPEDEFVGAIKQSTQRVLQMSALILVIAIALTVFVARLLSKQLRRVAEEAGRISNFELEDDFTLKSHIQEVNELSTAVTNMKTGLRGFGAYVPTDLVRAIVSSGKGVSVGGTARDLTLLFSDIEGFTAKTESLDPEILMGELSAYFAMMEKEISAHHGTVDKYMGDAIMALWNAPHEDPEHAVNGCRAMLACKAAERKLNGDGAHSHLVPVRTRFGLHSGPVVIGNVGSLSRMQYTALGATVNLASRIEGLNKRYGTDALVTQPVVERVGEVFVFREVDTVSPAGTTHPIKVFELIGEGRGGTAFPVSEDQYRELAEWKACHTLYLERRWQEALAAFEAHLGQASTPALVEAYISRCRAFIANPPPPDWNGVVEFTTK
ncbi:hypothetical protein GR183_15550 [Stappia sp. GBMRC 2046]|uniref:Guanylate cyclase domain-containing protein n=1 Tax=Stappia sediminis TaxID=2692190 RepID=A0A7X3S903_9HYPH|nr:adenylate/guanylate cyclase domain-containing protein [Stappia sediminis]MXN66329.1 hypothetical protein [Stappia sediminis]